MTWDLRLNPGTRDLELGIVSGPDEILQRLLTRLKRELGEWFLNTKAGLPWYGDGLGAKQNGGTQGVIGTAGTARVAGSGEQNNPARVGASRFIASGQGILGSKASSKRAVDLLIRRETLGTQGVERIIKLNTLFPAGGRTYSIYMEVFITGAGVVPINFEGEA